MAKKKKKQKLKKEKKSNEISISSAPQKSSLNQEIILSSNEKGEVHNLIKDEIKLSPNEEQEIHTLLHQRRKLQAIKRVKDITGAELKASIDYIKSLLLADDDDFPPNLKHREIMFSSQINLSPVEKEEVLNLLKEKGIVEAIKRLREMTGAGLKASKDYVDNLRSEIQM